MWHRFYENESYVIFSSKNDYVNVIFNIMN